MSELYFLGTGGSVATIERDNTAFLIKRGKTLILVDCPGSVIQKIKKLHFNPSQVSIILITHIHPDHVYGLPSFVHSLMLEDTVVRLYGSEEAIGFCRKLLDLFHLLDKEMKVSVDFRSLNPGQRVKLDNSVEINTFKVTHSSSSLSFHFFFIEKGKELIYSGDTPLNSFLFKEAEEKDFLIHDCSAPSRFFHKYPSLYKMHTHSLELGKFAQQARIKCLIPCHFFGELEFSLSEVEEEIKKNYQGMLIIPRDFGKITL